jgi:hypothetical protein
MTTCSSCNLGKWPVENRLYNFSFANFQEIIDLETITSVVGVTFTPTTGLTLVSSSYTSNSVNAQISGGTPGTSYRVLVAAGTSGGYTIAGEATLPVLQP